jgi:glycosyltransferase involved in cell wall biosynthesis
LFIRAHVERISEDVTPIYGDGSWFPVVDGAGARVVPRSFEFALRAGRRLPARLEAIARRPAESSLARLLNRRSIQVVLAEYGFSGVEMMGACRRCDVPLITVFHGFDAYRKGILERYGAQYRDLFQGGDRIVVGSRHMRAHLQELGAPSEKLHYNQMGADTELFSGADPAASAPIFLMLGNLVEEKAPHLSIMAFARVAKRHPEARLVIAGGGALRERCEKLIEKLGISARVRMLGRRPHDQVPEIMRGARALVQHSVTAPDGGTEGTAISVLEAGAAGLPVVATRIGGIADSVIDGETGFLVDPGDVDGMATRMDELVVSPDLSAVLGRAAQRRVREHFSLDRSIEGLRALIRDVVR